MIKFENVVKRYGKKVALDGVSFEILKGELFTLLGPNGAGKTTTLKLMAGLLKPDGGEIIVDGLRNFEDPETVKSLIGYIPDEPFIYPELSGREFVYFVGGLFDLDRKTLQRRFEELMERFEIGDWVDTPASGYSHGMRQRILFVQALIHEPDILIIDEPMVGLDPKGARIVKEVLREWVERGKTVVMSTHTLSLAEEISDRICLINRGKIAGVVEIERISEKGFSDVEELYFSFTED